MADVNAADLPDGSVVANADQAFIKNNPSQTAQWTSTAGGWLHSKYVQEAIDRGAVMLREGHRPTREGEPHVPLRPEP
jgi:hypothetical protein